MGKRRFLHGKRYRSPGTPPGSLLQSTSESGASFRCHTVHFGSSGVFEEEQAATCDPPSQWKDDLWLDITGVPRAGSLERLRDRLGLHELALEDVVTGGQRPKLDDYGDVLFVVLIRPYWVGGDVRLEQVSLFLGERFVVSIHESEDDLFAPIRRRLADQHAPLAEGGVERLFHALLDYVVDQGFPLLDMLGEHAEKLEENLLECPGPDTLTHIYQLKRDLLQLGRGLWPTREMLNRLMLLGSSRIGSDLLPYLKDVHDHVLFQVDLVEAHRELAVSLLDVYLSSASHRLNDIMRVLTIISTIFIPLTFVTGLYGMNFVVDTTSPWAMPLTHWRYGYPAVLVFMLMVAAGMLWFFRRKGWL